MDTQNQDGTDGALLRTHVEELLAEHLISVDYRPRGKPHADSGRRHVVIRPVLGLRSYFSALDQIGRVVTAGAGARLSPRTAAWEWASKHAIAASPSEVGTYVTAPHLPAAGGRELAA
jgi:hypothetical protein